MTLKDVQDWIAEIQMYAGDDERQHSSEDALYHAFVRAVADGTCEQPAECAALIRTTEQMTFVRWYA